MKQPERIESPQGKLAVFLPRMGAVATTFIAGCLLARKQQALRIGSLTQMGTIRLGKRTEDRAPKISEFAPLATLDQLEFGGWDPFADNAYEAAMKAEVLKARHLCAIKNELSRIAPMPAVFYPDYVKRLKGSHVKKAATKADMVEAVRDDIRSFKGRADEEDRETQKN
jgi:myo-inositol-1-phosphate synthase